MKQSIVLALFLCGGFCFGAEAAEDLRAEYTGQFVQLYLRGSYPAYQIERAPHGGDDFDILQVNETGCTSQCTYEDFAILFKGSYDYRIKVRWPDGTIQTFGPAWVDLTTGRALDLQSVATPNPVNPRTKISFVVPATLAQQGEIPVRMTLHDPSGRELAELWSRPLPVGEYEVPWDGRDGRGDPLPSGTYFYRIQASFHAEVGRLVLLR